MPPLVNVFWKPPGCIRIGSPRIRRSAACSEAVRWPELLPPLGELIPLVEVVDEKQGSWHRAARASPRTSADIRGHDGADTDRKLSILFPPGGLGYYRQGVPAGSWLAVDTFPLEGCSVTVNSAQIGM